MDRDAFPVVPKIVEIAGRGLSMGFIMISVVLISGLIGIICHLVISRVMDGRAVMKSLLACGGLSLVINLLSTVLLYVPASNISAKSDYTGVVIANILFEICGWYGYYALINLNLTSIRIRILKEIIKAGGALDVATLEQGYSHETMLQDRLGRLTSMGQLKMVDGCYCIDGTFWLYVAQIIERVKCLVFGHGVRMLNTGMAIGGKREGAKDGTGSEM